MKTKLKPAKLSTKRAVAAPTHAIVPLKERRLNFGNKWDFAPAPEDSKNYIIAPQHELFINGKFVAPTSGKDFESINPATEQTLTTIAAANAEDVDSAVKSARKAYDKVWSKMPGRERGKYLYRIARIIQEKARELAVLETMDGGKTIKESRDRARLRQHRCAQARRDHEPHGAAAGADFSGSGIARGRGEHRHWRGRN